MRPLPRLMFFASRNLSCASVVRSGVRWTFCLLVSGRVRLYGRQCAEPPTSTAYQFAYLPVDPRALDRYYTEMHACA